MSTVTKAMIPVAGWGTRRLPITKAVDKCMLPVGNRPIVDYVVRDCIKAGINEIYFVINQGSIQLQQYYSDNVRLNQFLEFNRKHDLIDLARPPHNVTFHYVEQDSSNNKYGTAIPVGLVYQLLKKGESIAFVQGDAFYHTSGDTSELRRLMTAVPEGGVGVLSSEVPKEDVSHYGVLDFNESGGLREIVEKPPVEQAPSNRINHGNYILNYELMTRIHEYCQLDVSGEYYITSVINQYAMENHVVSVALAESEYLDCGNVHSWLHANNVIVNRH